MIHVDEPVLPWPVLEARPLRPVVAGLLPEDLLKLGLRLVRAGERRVLELAGVAADPAPVREKYPGECSAVTFRISVSVSVF